MSELKVNSIKGVSASTAAITVNSSDGTCTANITNRSNRNILDNGDFRVAQRGTAALAMTDNIYNIDRWAYVGTSSRITTQQVEDGPPGFKYCQKVVSVGANTPSAADSVWYKLEGYEVKPLEYGTANAKTTTLSFWFKASATGTYGGSVQKHTLDRSCPFSFTVSAADTWEYKTVTIPGDTTSSTYRDTNLFSVSIKFSTGCASGYLGTAGTWAGSDYRGATVTVQIQATNAAYFSVTGIQWEIGSIATDFEHRSYGDEVLHCQRYLQKWISETNLFVGRGNGTATAIVGVPLAVALRASPTITMTGTAKVFEHDASSTSTDTPAVAAWQVNNPSMVISETGFSGLTDDRVMSWCITGSGTLTLSAEL